MEELKTIYSMNNNVPVIYTLRPPCSQRKTVGTVSRPSRLTSGSRPTASMSTPEPVDEKFNGESARVASEVNTSCARTLYVPSCMENRCTVCRERKRKRVESRERESRERVERESRERERVERERVERE